MQSGSQSHSQVHIEIRPSTLTYHHHAIVTPSLPSTYTYPRPPCPLTLPVMPTKHPLRISVTKTFSIYHHTPAPPTPSESQTKLISNMDPSDTQSCHCAENLTTHGGGFYHTCGAHALPKSSSNTNSNSNSQSYPRPMARSATPPPPAPAPNLDPATLKPWIQRRKTYIAHILILFNFWGIVLSWGPYMEYYYNAPILSTSSTPPSLFQLSLSPSLSILMMFWAPMPVGWLYQHFGFWRLSFYSGILVVVVCQWVLVLCKTWWHILLVRGVLQGFALGSVATAGTLSLGSHYKNNVPFASMIGAGAGMLGAGVYTAIPYFLLPGFHYKTVCFVNAGVVTLTLIPAGVLVKRDMWYTTLQTTKANAGLGRSTRTTSPLRNPKTILLLTAYLLTLSPLFIYPTYLPLLLSNGNPGSHVFPSEPAFQLLIAYIVAIPSYILASGKWWRTRFGVLNTWIMASTLGGTCYLNVGVMPYTLISWPATLLYGVCIGMLLSLHVKVLYTILAVGQRGRSVRGSGGAVALPHQSVGKVLVAVGAFSALGVVLTAWAVERGSGRFKWVFIIAGAVMVGGGVLMGLGVYWAGCWRRGRRAQTVRA